jgi:hypothetical protein
MKKLKIIYWANHSNFASDSTEKHISSALRELGHEVVEVPETENPVPYKGDLFLFHKGGENNGVHPAELVDILSQITYKKVCWYFDKIWNQREQWMNMIIPFTDLVFMTDETWARRHVYQNVKILHQGVGDSNTKLGKANKRYECDVAFTGSIYGKRQEFIDMLKYYFPEGRFRVFDNVFNQDLNDLCATAKVIVAPKFPSDDYYWSSRVYMVTGAGGFMVHPKLEGLKEEFEDGKEIVMYNTDDEMINKILHYLENDKERKAIQKAGHKKCSTKYTYKERVKELLNQCESHS